MNRKHFGDEGEHIAADVITGKGGTILAEQYRRRGGEIDLIARIGETIAFVEVKRRANKLHGQPAEAVDAVKRTRIVKTAAIYLYENHLEETRTRFDVIEILPGEIRWIENAFDASDIEY